MLAVAGVALLVIGLLTLRGHSPQKPNAAPPGTSSTAPSGTGSATTPTGRPSTSAPGSTSASPQPTTGVPPTTPGTSAGTTPPTARVPLTVLNNSKVHGLAERVADQARGKGWQVALVGNFAGRLPLTTIYFDPGDSAGERAAHQFAAEFPAVDQVLPRYDGLPPTPAGIVLVVTRNWPPDP